jgi:beta-lactamase regulating signal transducer with metallopeptidase domain
MIDETIAQDPWLWTLAWQSTVCLAAALAGSHVLRRQAVRAHQILFLGLVAMAVIPVVSEVVRQNQWGLFVAERTVPASEPGAPAVQDDLAIAALPAPTDSGRPLIAGGNPGMVSAPATAARISWTRYIMPVWLAASIVLLLRLVIQFLLGRHVAKQSEAVEDIRISHTVETTRIRLGVRVPIEIRATRAIRSPVIWCWGRAPILLIPEGPYREDRRLDWMSIVCHELAHHKRGDHLSGLFTELMVCLLPWQPLAWWTRRRLAALSEQACDDWVIASGQRATGYARTLLSLTAQGQAAFLPGVVAGRHGLAGRIRRILEDRCANPHPGLRWTLATVVLAGCVSLGIAFAQTRPAPQSLPTHNAHPQVSFAAAAGLATVDRETISLRLVDQNGRPVAGARTGAYVRVRETSVLGSRLEWLGGGTAGEQGLVTLEAKDVFRGERDKVALYILHEGRGIGAIHETARVDRDDKLPVVVLKPVCRVHGTLDSAGLAAIGMPLRWANMYARSNESIVLECSFPEGKHDFDFSLPPGAYTLSPYGSGSQGEDPPTISAATKSKALPVTISEGQEDLDLGVVDLSPTRLSTLIGHPAPELGPIQTWKNGAPVSLAQLRGQLVWLHFGGESPSASRDLPRLVELHETFRKGLTIIAIYNCASMGELEQRWTEVNERLGGVQNVPFRIAIDGGEPTFYEGTNRQRPGATYGRYDITSYPTNVLISPAGNVLGQPNMFLAKEIVAGMLGTPEKSLLPDWRQRFDAVYHLAEGEILKRIAPPFIPERVEYYNSDRRHSSGPDRITFHWDGRLRDWGMTFGDFGTLGSILNSVLRLRSYEYDGPNPLLDTELPGDWIIRDEASQEMKLQALEQLVARELGRKIRFERRSVEREVIVATGTFHFHPPVGTYENTSVHLYGAETDPDTRAGGGTADSLGEFLRTLGDRVNVPVVDRTEPPGDIRIPYSHHRSSYLGEIPDEQERAPQLRLILTHLTEQTEIQFEIREEPVPVWYITEQSDR